MGKLFTERVIIAFAPSRDGSGRVGQREAHLEDNGLDLQPAQPPNAAIPANEQQEVVFIEKYPDAAAFAEHVNGEVFANFRAKFIQYFHEHPDQPGWPMRETLFLEEQSGFVRE